MPRLIPLLVLCPLLQGATPVAAQVPRRVTFSHIECPRVAVAPLPVDTLHATGLVKPSLLTHDAPLASGAKGGDFVLLSYPVDVDGHIDLCHVSVLGESSPGWTKAVLLVLETYRYEPGRSDGVPIKVLVQQRIAR